MGYLLIAAVGALLGVFLARRLGASLPLAMVIGGGGAILGSFAVRALLAVLGFFALAIGAIGGAVLAVYLYHRLRGR